MSNINDFLGVAGATFPMFIEGGMGPMIFGSLPPATSSFTNSELPLFVDGRGFSSKQINLKVIGNLSAEGFLNLFVGGTGNPLSAVLPLFLFNIQVSATLPLFIQGLGEMDSALPASAQLNLFIKRPISAWLPLVLQSPGNSFNAELPLFMRGSGFATATLPLSIRNVSVVTSTTLPLYTHGF